ncbi:MAG: PilZ domain-containing protein [Pseudomonadota bacterium]
MKKRPFLIELFSCLYFISPLAILLELILINKLGFSGFIKVFNFVNWHVALLMLLTPVVGYGIWTVRRWGYYLLILHSVFVIFNNVVLYAGHQTLVPLWGVILFNISLVGVILMFVRKEVCAPYFNPSLRWWEQAVRYYADMKIVIKELNTEKVVFEAKTFDISETGAFIVTDRDVDIRDNFSLEVSLFKNSILYVDAEVVWTNTRGKNSGHPVGFGCRFIRPDSLFRKRIRFHMNDINAKIRARV